MMRRGGLLLSLAHSSPEAGGPWTASFVSGFLARLLLEPPSETLLESIERQPGSPLTHAGLSAGVESVVRRYREELPLDLGREWTRLFVGPKGAPCRPWHDTWEPDGPPRLYGPKHHSALRFWERAGLEPVNVATEPADHAGLVLALVSALCSRAAAEDAKSLDLLDGFWVAHVDTWLPRFGAAVRDESRSHAMEALGRLLLAAISRNPGEAEPS